MATARRIYAAQGFKKAKFFVAKYLQYFPYSRRWVRFIDGYYAHYTGGVAPVEMVRTKFLRSYYNSKLGPRARLGILKAHYQFLETHFRDHMVRTLLSGTEIRLASLTGKSGGLYDIGLAQHPRYRAEGDLTLFLRRRGDEIALAAITFSFGFSARHQAVLRIGGLQGPEASDGKQRVVDATRDLYGLRPKGAVLNAFYDIAAVFGATDIEAVGMANHPLNDRRHAVFADNDAFWTEQGAQPAAGGDFRLPVRPVVRTLDEVPAKKRKDWLARQALREAVTDQITPLIRSWFRLNEVARSDEDIRPCLVPVAAPAYGDFGLIAAE